LAETPIDETRFTDEEVREILKKAVESASSGALAKGDGMSLAELKTIGGEVGIDPTRLEDAARAVILAGRNRPNRFLGAPTVLNFERKVQGEFDPDDTPEILSLIRRSMGQPGEVDEIRGSLEWTGKNSDVGERFVTLTPRDGTTTITGASNLTGAAVLTFVLPGFFGLMTSIIGLAKFVKDGSEIGLILCLTILPILYPILRAFFSKISRSEATKIQQVVDDLALLTESTGEEDAS
jgi:hypothetical protein